MIRVLETQGLAVLLAAALLFVAVAGFAQPPQRVASLSLTADEILVEILPLNRLVACTAVADSSEMSMVAGRIPETIPRFARSDLERLVGLKPDLVIVSEFTDADFVRLLERSGLRYFRMAGLDSMEGFRQAVLDLGAAVGQSAAAQRLVAAYDARLEQVAQWTAGAARPRVLYWSQPYTVGARTAIGALIECAGAVNVGREMGLKGLASLGAERAFLADPDAILVGSSADAAALRAHPLLSRLRAVKQGRVLQVPARELVTLSQHAADACAALAQAFHPESRPLPAVPKSKIHGGTAGVGGHSGLFLGSGGVRD